MDRGDKKPYKQDNDLKTTNKKAYPGKASPEQPATRLSEEGMFQTKETASTSTESCERCLSQKPFLASQTRSARGETER